MKKWNDAEIVAVNISETANGWHCFWTEGDRRPWPLSGTHKTGLNNNTNTVNCDTVPTAETEVDEGRAATPTEQLS